MEQKIWIHRTLRADWPDSLYIQLNLLNYFYFQYEFDSSLTISRDGPSQSSPLYRLHNDIIYKGSENELVLEHIYSTKFICLFDLAYYPFDTQKCTMKFKLDVREYSIK